MIGSFWVNKNNPELVLVVKKLENGIVYCETRSGESYKIELIEFHSKFEEVKLMPL